MVVMRLLHPFDCVALTVVVVINFVFHVIVLEMVVFVERNKLLIDFIGCRIGVRNRTSINFIVVVIGVIN